MSQDWAQFFTVNIQYGPSASKENFADSKISEYVWDGALIMLEFSAELYGIIKLPWRLYSQNYVFVFLCK